VTGHKYRGKIMMQRQDTATSIGTYPAEGYVYKSRIHIYGQEIEGWQGYRY
jgi:hypothetical protein